MISLKAFRVPVAWNLFSFYVLQQIRVRLNDYHDAVWSFPIGSDLFDVNILSIKEGLFSEDEFADVKLSTPPKGMIVLNLRK